MSFTLGSHPALHCSARSRGLAATTPPTLHARLYRDLPLVYLPNEAESEHAARFARPVIFAIKLGMLNILAGNENLEKTTTGMKVSIRNAFTRKVRARETTIKVRPLLVVKVSLMPPPPNNNTPEQVQLLTYYCFYSSALSLPDPSCLEIKEGWKNVPNLNVV